LFDNFPSFEILIYTKLIKYISIKIRGINAMSASTHSSTAIPTWLDLVQRKVEGLHYGQVYIVVHDHQVTQVECLERTRLSPSRPASLHKESEETDR